MVPGFSGLHVSDQSLLSSETVRLAGLWDTPDQKVCRPARTDTFCTGLVLWCKDVFICTDRNSPLGHEESRTPYPCGVCVGITSPDDW